MMTVTSTTTQATGNLSEDVAGQLFADTRRILDEFKQVDSGAMFLHRHHKELISLELVHHLPPHSSASEVTTVPVQC